MTELVSVPIPVPKPCPACGEGPGTLTIRRVLVSRPLGSFSLAGAGLKTSAREGAALECSACDMQAVGYLDPDGRHLNLPDGPPTPGTGTEGS